MISLTTVECRHQWGFRSQIFAVTKSHDYHLELLPAPPGRQVGATNISNRNIVPKLKSKISWKWDICVGPKRRCLRVGLMGVTAQTTAILLFCRHGSIQFMTTHRRHPRKGKEHLDWTKNSSFEIPCNSQFILPFKAIKSRVPGSVIKQTTRQCVPTSGHCVNPVIVRVGFLTVPQSVLKWMYQKYKKTI